MAADTAIDTATGALGKAGSWTWDRVKPTPAGLGTTLGVGLVFVAATAVAAPAAMAAATPALTAPAAGAGAGSQLAHLATTGVNQFFSAVSVTADGITNIATNADWSTVGEGFNVISGGLGGETLTSAAPVDPTAGQTVLNSTINPIALAANNGVQVTGGALGGMPTAGY